MKRITHRIRWWIALIADLLVFIPSGAKTGFWQRLPNIGPWTLLFWVSGFGLIALSVVQLWDWMQSHFVGVQQSNNLAAKPAEPTLKERTIQLANELFELLKKQGPEPPDPLSLTLSQRGSEQKQERLLTAYFDWQRHLYFNYMAYFRDRVAKLDYELAAARIFTKLEDDEINPPRAKGQVDIKRIAETLLLEANRISD